jgi:hypothetical protein
VVAPCEVGYWSDFKRAFSADECSSFIWRPGSLTRNGTDWANGGYSN